MNKRDIIRHPDDTNRFPWWIILIDVVIGLAIEHLDVNLMLAARDKKIAKQLARAELLHLENLEYRKRIFAFEHDLATLRDLYERLLDLHERT